MALFFAYSLMMLFIYTKFGENISKDLLSGHDSHREISNENNFFKNVVGIKVLILCTSSDDALFLY